MNTVAQDIEVGPVRVDTGDNWMDFGFVVVLMILAAALVVFIRKKRR